MAPSSYAEKNKNKTLLRSAVVVVLLISFVLGPQQPVEIPACPIQRAETLARQYYDAIRLVYQLERRIKELQNEETVGQRLEDEVTSLTAKSRKPRAVGIAGCSELKTVAGKGPVFPRSSS